jgi:hypothetical protein
MFSYDTGPLPFKLIACFDEESFQGVMTEMGVNREFIPKQGALSHSHFFEGNGNLVCVLCFDFPKGTHSAITAAHVVLELHRSLKELWDYIEESHPGIELEGQYLYHYTAAIMASIK